MLGGVNICKSEMINKQLVHLTLNETRYSQSQGSKVRPIQNVNAGRGLRLVDYDHRPNVTTIAVDGFCLASLVDSELSLVPK